MAPHGNIPSSKIVSGSASPSLPGYVVWGVILFLLITGGLLFLTTDTYMLIKARKLYSNRKYVAGLDIVDAVIGRKGPDENLLSLRDEGLFRLGHLRMDMGDYSEAIPLLDRIISGNEEYIGDGGSRERMLEALQDKVVCHLILAQGRGKYVDPFDQDLTYAEDAIDRGLELALEMESENTVKLSSVLYILHANIMTERAAYFWDVGDSKRARAYLFSAEGDLNTGLANNPELRREYKKLINKIAEMKDDMGE